MEKKYVVLVLAILGYVGAILGGIWNVIPADTANSAKDAMLAIISIILASIGHEVQKLKVKMGVK